MDGVVGGLVGCLIWRVDWLFLTSISVKNPKLSYQNHKVLRYSVVASIHNTLNSYRHLLPFASSNISLIIIPIL